MVLTQAAVTLLGPLQHKALLLRVLSHAAASAGFPRLKFSAGCLKLLLTFLLCCSFFTVPFTAIVTWSHKNKHDVCSWICLYLDIPVCEDTDSSSSALCLMMSSKYNSKYFLQSGFIGG